MHPLPKDGERGHNTPRQKQAKNIHNVRVGKKNRQDT